MIYELEIVDYFVQFYLKITERRKEDITFWNYVTDLMLMGIIESTKEASCRRPTLQGYKFD